ncbi:MAG TPA: hypothetical protein PKK43_13340 [Spirochaetota bacterium]|nr:hypothetical protein [Spirochaetota bacterium]
MDNESIFTNLEEKLKATDWHYYYSDDPRWYREGHERFVTACSAFTEAEKVDKRRAVELWNKYSPNKIEIPA